MLKSRSIEAMGLRRIYLLAGVLIALSLGAMVWSAARPGTGLGAGLQITVTAQNALSDFADWARRGPASGTSNRQDAAYTVQGGDARRGGALMIQYGCGACHVIPGVTAARGTVGPSLAGFRDRAYVAGILPNEPGGLVAWLVNPVRHAPKTAMPDLDVTEDQARHMAAYLYTLRGS